MLNAKISICGAFVFMLTSAQKIMLLTDKHTEHILNRACGCARYAYNWARQTWLDKKKQGIGSVSINSILKEFNANKTPWMKESPKDAMAQAIMNFGLAKKRHYENPKQYGFPKKKKYSSKRSFYITNDHAYIKNGYIKIPRVKNLVRLAEPLCANCLNGKINNYVISFGSNGKWFVSISYTYDESSATNYTPNNGLVGIDVGIKTLMRLSSGESVGNPKIFRKHNLALRRYQRRMSRRTKGSTSYKRVKARFNKKNAYIANYRKDLIHKTTTEIARSNCVIAIEDLNVKGMLKNHSLASAISDCGFYKIRQFLEYKCEKYGALLLKVDRFFPSSKKCSGCGHVKENLSLSDREYICEHCGIVLDRDTNAAVNILAEALFTELENRYHTDLARREYTPMEIVALANRSVPVSEPTVCEVQCRTTRKDRMALVDSLFGSLWNQVAHKGYRECVENICEAV